MWSPILGTQSNEIDLHLDVNLCIWCLERCLANGNQIIFPENICKQVLKRTKIQPMFVRKHMMGFWCMCNLNAVGIVHIHTYSDCSTHRWFIVRVLPQQKTILSAISVVGKNISTGPEVYWQEQHSFLCARRHGRLFQSIDRGPIAQSLFPPSVGGERQAACVVGWLVALVV